MSTYSFRWDSYPQPARNSQVERNGRGVYASIPAHPLPCSPGLGLLQRERKNRWPSSGIGPERRKRWHGATGSLAVEASQDGGELGLLRLPRKHKAPDYPCRGTLCGCWFSAGRLMVWSVTRPPPVVQAQLDTPPCPALPKLLSGRNRGSHYERRIRLMAGRHSCSPGGERSPGRRKCRGGRTREFTMPCRRMLRTGITVTPTRRNFSCRDREVHALRAESNSLPPDLLLWAAWARSSGGSWQRLAASHRLTLCTEAGAEYATRSPAQLDHSTLVVCLLTPHTALFCTALYRHTLGAGLPLYLHTLARFVIRCNLWLLTVCLHTGIQRHKEYRGTLHTLRSECASIPSHGTPLLSGSASWRCSAYCRQQLGRFAVSTPCSQRSSRPGCRTVSAEAVKARQPFCRSQIGPAGRPARALSSHPLGSRSP
jgi:hypothetical protein